MRGAFHIFRLACLLHVSCRSDKLPSYFIMYTRLEIDLIWLNKMDQWLFLFIYLFLEL
jgi:hypothetical protein